MIRLINARTLQLEEFEETQYPGYVALSHRWAAPSEEVSYHDFLSEAKRSTSGWEKIKNCCRLARDHWGVNHCWIDTCCIDKKSSAELSEAINSMWSIFRNAAACFVYLADVPDKGGQIGGRILEEHVPLLAASAWFTRGWTLQELLAPEEVVFIDSTWTPFSNKSHLADRLSVITGINAIYLTNYDWLSTASVATKISWVSKRQTTRREDLAYCLLGIFDINMPLLYGEGDKAFMRLQLEIIRKSPDRSIFA